MDVHTKDACTVRMKDTPLRKALYPGGGGFHICAY